MAGVDWALAEEPVARPLSGRIDLRQPAQRTDPDQGRPVKIHDKCRLRDGSSKACSMRIRRAGAPTLVVGSSALAVSPGLRLRFDQRREDTP
jgi:hypothetical protein